MQSCAFMDAGTLEQMMGGLDQLLPPADGGSVAPKKSAAEQKAERDAQRAEADRRQAERETRRAAEQARAEAEQKLVSDVVRRPPTARSAKGQLMSREDDMWRASIIDWDVHEGRARLLYETLPSREQQRRPDAARHIYVVEMDRNDNIVQRHMFETTLARTVTAGLLRGRDEIIVQWHEGGVYAEESTLERWSISKAEILARAPGPRLQGPRGALSAEHHFQLVTVGGELLYATAVALETGPNPKGGVSWMLASPAGEVRDKGLIVLDDESISAVRPYHSADGGAGLIMDIIAIGEQGIDSRLRPDAVRLGNAEIRPVVMSERRLYAVGGTDAGSSLPAFERRLLWLGLENVDRSYMLSGESTRVMRAADNQYRVDDSTVYRGVAGRNRPAVAPTEAGHALLIRNNAGDESFPPTKGLWLQEFAAGQARRDTYLDPDGRHLDSIFDMLASDGGDKLYVGSRDVVLLLNGEREVLAYSRSSVTDAEIKAMIADGSSVWLFGEHYGDRDVQQQMWIERLQF